MGELEDYYDDVMDDGKLSESNQERLKRTGRSLFQGAVAAVVVTVADSVMSAVQGSEAFDTATVGKLALAAVVTSVVAYFHKRKTQ